MARRGSLEESLLTDTNYYILLAMVKPIHGYAIMQKVKEISNNSFEIGPASLYTSLKKLSTLKFIRLVDTKNEKKIYQMTQTGKELLLKDFKRRKTLVEHGEKILGVE